jgi:hypothetical protein
MARLRNSILLSLAAAASARDIPSNVRDFYDSVRNQVQCYNKLKSGFHSIQGDNGGKCIALLLHPELNPDEQSEQRFPTAAIT